MDEHERELLFLVAEAFCYPAPGQVERIVERLERVPPGDARRAVESFVGKVRLLSLGEWEELYTRTLDLNPPAAPYIGFQTWGESYQRGLFLSTLNRALLEAGVETEGELPDHLIPVLRYLGQAVEPLPELVEVLSPALRRIHDVLRQADAASPYLDLLAAAQGLCKVFNLETT
jgi:nitrate reductase delta subunit